MASSSDRRSGHRVTAGAYIEYRVTIDGTQVKDAIMSDISEGGLMILVETADVGRELKIGEALSGHIVHDRTRFDFPYAGEIAWLQAREMRSRSFIALGVRFKETIELPAQIYAILMADHDF